MIAQWQAHSLAALMWPAGTSLLGYLHYCFWGPRKKRELQNHLISENLT